MMNKALLTVVLAGGLTSAATAGTVRVSDIGGGVTLTSGPLGPEVFGNSQTSWTTTSMLSAHDSLRASGINTNMKITFLLADTTHGLSMMALIDEQQATPGTSEIGHVGMASVGQGANLAYLNAQGGDVVISPNGPGSRTAIGNFDWNFHGAGNAFAWADLQVGNTMTWRFHQIAGQALGLMTPATFQFVTWTGNNWSLVDIPAGQLSFTATGDFGFSSTVVTSIPLPAGAAMAGASLAMIPMIRRRRAV
jgi:hypothetical protein